MNFNVGVFVEKLNIITVVFNPFRFKSRYTLYNQFEEYISKFDVNLITVEIAFGERPFEVTVPNNINHVQLRTNCELWHKERALNIGLQRLTANTPDWKYVAWMDCDIQFACTDWDTETVQLLQHYAVLQMFSQATLLGPTHCAMSKHDSIMVTYEKFGNIGGNKTYCGGGNNPGINAGWSGHPGLAWAFRRFELEHVNGWLDICINGSADLHMAGCYAGTGHVALHKSCSKGYQDRIMQYQALCETYIRRNIGFMPGLVMHYWHGKTGTRGYDKRWKLNVKYNFDPNTDLVLDLNGLYKFNDIWPNVLKLRYDTRKTLMQRNEDSIDE